MLRRGLAPSRTIATRAFATTTQTLPYDQVPGPKPIPFLGNKFRFFPGFQKYDFTNLINLHKQLRDEFGDIVRFSGLEPRRDLLFIFKPEDIETVFRNEGLWPERPSFKALKYYRDVTKKDVFQGLGGVLVDQGSVWQEARSHVNPIMMKTQIVHMYADKIGAVAEEFVNLIPKWRDAKNEMSGTFKNEIHKWALESIALVALDARLGCLQENLPADSEPQRMIDSVHLVLQCLHALEMGNSTLWTKVSTPTWSKFEKTMDYFTGVALKYVNEAIERIKKKSGDLEGDKQSVLERFLQRDPNPTRAVVMALDMLMAGVDTTSHALTNVLLHLSANQDKQQKLFEELKRVFPNPSTPITNEMLDEMKFMRACIKESARMMPVVTANARTTQKEIVLSNFRIPKEVDVIMPHAVISRLSKHYTEPDAFIPERWMRGGEQEEKANPFVTLPFGHGARKCIGMRFASLELEMVLAKMIRRYNWRYEHGEMNYQTFLVHVPMDPLKFKVTERTH
ncbi:probable cytochrome P450 301a1, mitochondrial [Neocloeon triangulifer]|uniref:probable cytochrome P450 301a1, mitochondrial n=1 Tax=Neocloeon triangulifer TaxID=2078957 RepID=UPI00286F40F8|nr:probable cytochrome P450 301a1, mitochondrial [Neocloeon triangulifer]